jgi:hypothetical protein
MKAQNEIKLFESKKVRTSWNEDEEEWYFSIIDIIDTLTESSIPKRYWSDLKKKLLKEGSQLYEKIVQLKMELEDSLLYLCPILKYFYESFLCQFDTLQNPTSHIYWGKYFLICLY